MKIPVQKLSGRDLDWAVGQVAGIDPRSNPSSQWTVAGPIIHRFGVTLRPFMRGWDASVTKDGRKYHAHGDTALHAAMRALVSAHLGGEIDIPEDR